MNSASQWQWLGGFFGRQPIKLQSELEEWTNATEQPGPTDAQNVYLYTGLLPVSSIELTTSPRWLIVLAASAIVLAISTLLMYLPTGRRNWVLAVLACAIAAGAIAYPTPALLVAQAAAIGLVLSVVAVLLSHLSRAPIRIPVAPVVSQSSQRMATPRSDSRLMPPVISAASTAPTASLHISELER